MLLTDTSSGTRLNQKVVEGSAIGQKQSNAQQSESLLGLNDDDFNIMNVDADQAFEDPTNVALEDQSIVDEDSV